ncbi:hypothetical protein L7F22_014436 [Adiantum nelumboides]|nr:hypothetical protein [Adiantum nelumboides]
MESEIEVISPKQPQREAADGGGHALSHDLFTAAAYGDLEKLQHLVEVQGFSVSQPDGAGYFPLQWTALNNRSAAAQYLLEAGGLLIFPSLLKKLSFSC